MWPFSSPAVDLARVGRTLLALAFDLAVVPGGGPAGAPPLSLRSVLALETPQPTLQLRYSQPASLFLAPQSSLLRGDNFAEPAVRSIVPMALMPYERQRHRREIERQFEWRAAWTISSLGS